ncbi:translocase [Methanocella sp. CWC-04]|uniref:Sec-independent protein translocase protein TatC n=1 Tax=Methanooceanicella nereidis TaxID=2052831 RepID=A0AAP2RCF4_9EURY|nr:translocase [Methanocella sp. CWC-04]
MVKFKNTIIYLLLYVLVVSSISFPFTGNIILRMRDDLLVGQYILIQTQPLELMMLQLKMSIIIGIIAALPVLFYLAYKQVKERKLGHRLKISKLKLALWLISALALFTVGCAYSYYLMLPFVFQYLLQSAVDVGVANHWKVTEFINFAIMTTFVFGLVFELPLVMTILARSGIVPVEIFKRYRRHMYIVILIVAALVTSPDVITQIMVGVPLIIFYELSLFLLRFTVKPSRANVA